MRFLQLITLVLASLLCSINSYALPDLEVRSRNQSDQDTGNPISLQDISVKLSPGLGAFQITIEATLFNHGDDEEEAEFLLAMPKGAIINDYALDIDGVLVSGVLTEKQRAEKIYTDKVVENIDPGIAERISDNRYKTRIYPVEPGETRKTRLGFAVPSENGLKWALNYDRLIKNIWLDLPQDTVDDLAYSKTETGIFQAKNAKLELELAIAPDRKTPLAEILEHPKAGPFFVTRLTPDERSKLVSQTDFIPKDIVIIWDQSLSRQTDNHAKEIGALKTFLSLASPESIRLISGSGRIMSDKTYSGPNGSISVLNDLNNIHYDGGSDFAALLDFQTSADICIFVSDGRSTLGGKALSLPDCPIYSLSTSSDPNISFFQNLANSTGGWVIPDKFDKNMVIATFSQSPRPFISNSNFKRGHWIGSLDNGLYIAPIKKQSRRSKLTLKDRNGNIVKIRRRAEISKSRNSLAPITLWAAIEAETLRAEGKSISEIINFSRPFSLAGSESALLVLEDPEDYVSAEVKPPSDYPNELMSSYKEKHSDYQVELSDEKEDRLDDIIDIWEDQIDWWTEKYDIEPSHALTEPPLAIEDTERSAVRHWDGTVTYEDLQEPAPIVTQNLLGDDQIIVTGSRRSRTDDEVVVMGSKFGETIDIEIRKWSPDRPYLKAMAASAKSEWHTTYKNQQKIYGNLPAYYLEMADFFAQNNDNQSARHIIVGALELPSANTETYTLVAHRLLTYGDFDRAIELYEQALEIAPNLPQSYYNLAIALKDRAQQSSGRAAQNDYIRALNELDYIIRTPWDFMEGEDYDGIELVALMEANAIIPYLSSKNRKHNPLDKALVKKLDVDQRIVMDWNIDHADIDLWVYEPTDEKASYSNQLTAIGGQVSNDMTDGYGPEQYLLRKAPSGEYSVKTDFYSESEYNPNGAVTVRTRITKNFARKNEVTKTIIVELLDDNDEIEIATFIVK